MSTIWRKLNLKNQSEIVVLNGPASFEIAIAALGGRKVARRLGPVEEVAFILSFVTRRREIEEIADRIGAKAGADPVVWFAYPKKSSRRYACDFDRDSGWEPLGRVGFEAVRQVAIDADWSALRFRRVGFIKKMKRDPARALSKEGREKASRPSPDPRADDTMTREDDR